MKDFTEKDKEQFITLLNEDTSKLEEEFNNALANDTIKFNARKQCHNYIFDKKVYKALINNFETQYDLQNVTEINDIRDEMNRRQAITGNNIWVIIGIGLMFVLGVLSFGVVGILVGLLLKPLTATGLAGNVISSIQCSLFVIVGIVIAGAVTWCFLNSLNRWENNTKAWNSFNKRRTQYSKRHAKEHMIDFINDKEKEIEWWY